MARIRSVSPGLRTSETAAQWDREARYAWVLLWGYLDDYGRGVDNARVIAADCFPLDDDVTPQLMGHWMDLYEAGGSICRYEYEGKRYLHVLNWSDHQKPQHPSKVRVPPCERHEAGAHRRFVAERAAEHMRVSGNPHEGFVSPSPTSRGGGEVSKESSEEMRGGPESGDPDDAPPLFAGHCAAHAHTAVPGNCGACKDQRVANETKPRALALVTSSKRCIVHDQSYTRACTGCEADRKAGEVA
jgi:hypothetical protein